MLLAAAVLAFAPPERGTMLLVPIASSSIAEVEQVGLSAGATPGLFGPLPSSLFVEGERARLLPAALAHGMILINLSPQLCGQPQVTRI